MINFKLCLWCILLIIAPAISQINEINEEKLAGTFYLRNPHSGLVAELKQPSHGSHVILAKQKPHLPKSISQLWKLDPTDQSISNAAGDFSLAMTLVKDHVVGEKKKEGSNTQKWEFTQGSIKCTNKYLTIFPNLLEKNEGSALRGKKAKGKNGSPGHDQIWEQIPFHPTATINKASSTETTQGSAPTSSSNPTPDGYSQSTSPPQSTSISSSTSSPAPRASTTSSSNSSLPQNKSDPRTGYYFIVLNNSNLVLDTRGGEIKDYSPLVVMHPNVKYPNSQLFSINDDYTITQYASNKSIDIFKGIDGNDAVVHSKTLKPSQQWRYDPINGAIKCRFTGKALSVVGDSLTTDKQVEVLPYKVLEGQAWKLIPWPTTPLDLKNDTQQGNRCYSCISVNQSIPLKNLHSDLYSLISSIPLPTNVFSDSSSPKSSSPATPPISSNCPNPKPKIQPILLDVPIDVAKPFGDGGLSQSEQPTHEPCKV